MQLICITPAAADWLGAHSSTNHRALPMRRSWQHNIYICIALRLRTCATCYASMGARVRYPGYEQKYCTIVACPRSLCVTVPGGVKTKGSKVTGVFSSLKWHRLVGNLSCLEELRLSRQKLVSFLLSSVFPLF